MKTANVHVDKKNFAKSKIFVPNKKNSQSEFLCPKNRRAIFGPNEPKAHSGPISDKVADSGQKVILSDSGEEQLLKHLIPKIEERMEERLRYRIVQSIIDALEEQVYPPEEMIREDFIKSVEEAEKEQGKVFRDVKELKQYLEGLDE